MTIKMRYILCTLLIVGCIGGDQETFSETPTTGREPSNTVLLHSDEALNNQAGNQLSFIVLSCILAVTCVYYSLKTHELRQELEEAKVVLANFKEVRSKREKVELSLKMNDLESARLLDHNNRVLFSKILKISTCKDAIEQVVTGITQLIENNDTIETRKLLTVEKTLRSLIEENDIWEDFHMQFEKTRPNFFKKLKQIAPSLSVNDLKHCTYVVEKLNTKEVADLIHISPRSVETVRYRLKKKLGLDKESCLFEFLQAL